MLFPSNGPDATRLAEWTSADPRFQPVESTDPADLVRAARGEFIALLHGDATPEPTLLRLAVRRLDTKRRDSAVTVGYLAGDTAYRNVDDVAAIDAAWDLGSTGLPVFEMSRRREWMKAMGPGTGIGDAHVTLRRLVRSNHLDQPLVALRAAAPTDAIGSELLAFTSPRAKLLKDLYAAGPSPAAVRILARSVVGAARPDPPPRPVPNAPDARPTTSLPTIRYVGWTGKENLGDDALLQAITGLLDWGRVQTSKRADLLLLGGGTLINREPYLDWLEDNDSPRIERAVLGTGVANPGFWGRAAESARWKEWLGTCAYLGVRGPHSAAVLGDWGVEAEVVGDAALMFESSADPIDGLVVVSPCRTRGELWGGADDAVIDGLVDVIDELGRQGRPVTLIAAHPDDDGPCIQIMRRTSHRAVGYLSGYEDVDRALSLFASADLVVAERLHSAVLAAAVGTAFIGLEYRPKVRDFAASLNMERQVIRTDQLDGLGDLVEASLEERSEICAHMIPQVERYRCLLRAAAERLRVVMAR
jgi:hypothetical protein